MRHPILTALLGSVCLLFAFTLKAKAQDSAAQAALPTSAITGSSQQPVVPRQMKFNGVLHDATGKPMTGTFDVAFALYGDEAGGDPLWFETQSVQADDQGRYTALIGVMHSDGLPMDLFTTGEARWLGAQVANEPEQKPRVLLLSVPYALKAADAETLGGLPASAFVVAPGFSPAGASAPASGTAASAAQTGASGAPTHRNSSGHKAAACSSVTSDGTATANSITMFTTSCNIESSAISQSSGNIGIGTQTPNTLLHLLGANDLGGTYPGQLEIDDNTAMAPGVGGKILLGYKFTSGGAITYGPYMGAAKSNSTSGDSGADLVFAPRPSGSAPAEVMRINSLGYVGIGTTSPTGTLSVVSNGAPLPPQSATLALAAPAGIVPFRMKQNTPGSTTPALIDLETSDGKLAQLSAGGTGLFQINATAGNAMAFATNGFTPRMYIDTSGNVGIGTMTPAAKLDLNGNLNLPFTNGTVGTITLGGTNFIHACCNGVSSQNTFIGLNAGNLTMTGASNLGMGGQALANNMNGSENTGIGLSSLQNNSSGSFNTANGDTALQQNTMGNSNTATGAQALQLNTIGSYNTAIGSQAGVTGNTGNANVSGSNNTFIGYASGPGTSTQLMNATAIGSYALVSESNALVLGGTGGNAVNVGIGTQTPTTTLQVAGGDISTATAGSGLIVKSPDGTKCARIGIDNNGAISVTSITCP